MSRSPRLLAVGAIFPGRHAEDTVFERWSQGVLDVLASELLTYGPARVLLDLEQI